MSTAPDKHLTCAGRFLQLEQLKQDFRYNLTLLEDRDAELDKYDSDTAVLVATLSDRDRQIIELKKGLADITFGAWQGAVVCHSRVQTVLSRKQLLYRVCAYVSLVRPIMSFAGGG